MKKLHCLFLLLSFATVAQRTELFVDQADQYFAAAQYMKAIPVYKAALEKNPRYVKAKYKLGECYRLMLDYESAQFYYGDIAKNNDSRYPLAGFYFGLMQKLRGKYSDALTSLKIFQKFLRDLDQHQSDKYRTFYKQAKIEIDGCQLALNQIAMQHPDYGFGVAGEGLNSAFNDYAAFTIGNDDMICVTSGRKGGKGGLQNATFGETYEDLFRFQRDANGSWKSYDVKDRFESLINTKWGEGSGSFNKERTKFYYTNCNDDIGGVCHIYVSSLIDGRWSEPISLNANINQSGSSSQHPNLTPGGDTLFFASDRAGTIGGFDIWMSLNAGEDNWSPPLNLGNQINTAFNEVSPFYSQNEYVLFFASDGHRGFGGYDIYIAKGRNFKEAEIYNGGLPFNSNKDDIFFFLGDQKGLLSSNRQGGIGKFDIYEFDITSKSDVIDEVSNPETIAGRNSLFTEDYNFDSEKTEIINQIISRKISSSFSQINLMLSTEQLTVYNSLKDDDKERIDKIVSARIRKMTQSSLRSIRSEDEYYYQQLDADKRRKVDGIVGTYLEEQGLGLSISLSQESNEFYNSENATDRERLDILISERLKTSAEYKPKSIHYKTLSTQEKQNVDGIALKYLDQKKSINGIKLSVAERVFMRDVTDEKEVTVNSAIKEKLLEMSREERFRLLLEDNEFYEDLTPDQRESLKSVATAFLIADLNSFDQIVDQRDLTSLNNLGVAAKKKLNKLILKLVSNLASADAYKAETLFQTGELLAADSKSADETLKRLFSLDRGLTTEDKASIERFVRSTYKAYLQEAPVFIKPKSDTDEFDIQKRVPFYSASFLDEEYEDSNEPFMLTEDMLAKYEALPADKKTTIDKLIGLEYIKKAYADSGIEQKDPNDFKKLDQQEKVHIEILAKSFRGQPANEDEIIQIKSAFAFYNNLAESRKATFNRYILSKVFIKRNGKYSLDYADAEKSKNLTNDERSIRHAIQKFRFQNERIITENQEVEALDYPDTKEEPIVLVKAEGDEVTAEAAVEVSKLNEVAIDLPDYKYEGFGRIVMTGKLHDGSGNVVKSQSLTLHKQDGSQTSITGFTDEQGIFEFKIPANEYKMIADVTEGNSNLSVSGFFVEGLDAKSSYESSSVAYFDTNSDQLRSEAQLLLDEIIAAYKKNPMKIEVESHTDAVGNEAFNKKLSRRRGNSAFNYLVQKGVKKSDLSVVWHGFEKPIASNDNPYGRQLNRRMDIRMIGNSQITFSSSQYFLVRPNAKLSSIAKSLDISTDEIMKTNGLKSQQLRPYQPIRIKSGKPLKVDINLLIPSSSSVAADHIYIVKGGETLHDIARKFNVPEELIVEENNMSGTAVKEGMELVIYTKD